MAMQFSTARASRRSPDLQRRSFASAVALRREHAIEDRYGLVPSAQGSDLSVREAGDAGSSPYLNSRPKRALDLTGAVSVLFLLLPLMLMIAILIRMTSKGPVLFKQMRCGANGQPFPIYKFRSMYIAEEVPTTVAQASRGDARVTPIGRFIRRTSIDELPQLVNILQGHMSLIGPRPHAISHDAYYGEHIPHYGRRFAARPGLSGLAQVSGARGATPLLSDMERRIELDLIYIRSASLTADLKILAATAHEAAFSSTAY